MYSGTPDVAAMFWHQQLEGGWIPRWENPFTTQLTERIKAKLNGVVLRQEVQLNQGLRCDLVPHGLRGALNLRRHPSARCARGVRSGGRHEASARIQEWSKRYI
jgi:hypothetical protein